MALQIQGRPCVEDNQTGPNQNETAPLVSRNSLVTKIPKSGLQLNVAKYATRQSANESKISIPDQREDWRYPVFVAETMTGELP